MPGRAACGEWCGLAARGEGIVGEGTRAAADRWHEGRSSGTPRTKASGSGCPVDRKPKATVSEEATDERETGREKAEGRYNARKGGALRWKGGYRLRSP